MTDKDLDDFINDFEQDIDGDNNIESIVQSTNDELVGSIKDR